MKTTVLWALVVINALLFGSFLSRFTNSGSAIAQPNRAQPARPGDYLMIPGEVSGGSAGIVYIVDMTNGRLGAMSYDESNRKLVTMQATDLAPIFQAAARGAGAGAGGGARPNRGTAARPFSGVACDARNEMATRITRPKQPQLPSRCSPWTPKPTPSASCS